MMKPVTLLSVILTGVFGLGTFTGCEERDKPLDRAGENLEDAAEDVGDAVEDAAEDIEKGVEDATDGR